jgi:hypothetical protein
MSDVTNVLSKSWRAWLGASKSAKKRIRQLESRYWGWFGVEREAEDNGNTDYRDPIEQKEKSGELDYWADRQGCGEETHT